MSLLNEALRKREREAAGRPAVHRLASESPGARRSDRRRFIAASAGGALLLAVILILVGLRGELRAPVHTSSPGQRPGQQLKVPAAGDVGASVPSGDSTLLPSSVVHEAPRPVADEILEVNAAETIRGPIETLRAAVSTPPVFAPEAIPGRNPEASGPQVALEPPLTDSGTHGSGISEPSRKSPEASTLYRKARRLQEQGNGKEAMRLYSQALEVNPDHVPSLRELSAAHLGLKDYPSAYPLLLRLQKLEPEDAEVPVNLAVAQLGLGHPEEALASLDRARQGSDSPGFKVHFHTGVTQSRLGRLDQAVRSYQAAEKLNPDHPSLLFNMGLAFDKLGRFAEAVRYYNAFLAHADPGSGSETEQVAARIQGLRTYLSQTQQALGSQANPPAKERDGP